MTVAARKGKTLYGILRYLLEDSGGKDQLAEICTDLGLNKKTAWTIINRLVGDGLVRKSGYGQYAITRPGVRKYRDKFSKVEELLGKLRRMGLLNDEGDIMTIALLEGRLKGIESGSKLIGYLGWNKDIKKVKSAKEAGGESYRYDDRSRFYYNFLTYPGYTLLVVFEKKSQAVSLYCSILGGDDEGIMDELRLVDWETRVQYVLSYLNTILLLLDAKLKAKDAELIITEVGFADFVDDSMALRIEPKSWASHLKDMLSLDDFKKIPFLSKAKEVEHDGKG